MADAGLCCWVVVGSVNVRLVVWFAVAMLFASADCTPEMHNCAHS